MSALKLEVGKSYVTRDGRKVTITSYNPEWSYKFHSIKTYRENGRFNVTSESHEDLIAPWVDMTGAFTTSESPEDQRRARAQELVDKANQGFEAMRILNRDGHVVQLKYGRYGEWKEWEDSKVIHKHSVRLKPQAPTLPGPTTLHQSGYKVSVESNPAGSPLLKIGCVQGLDLVVTRSYFIDLCKRNAQSAGPFEADRAGVNHLQGRISWADADQLLAYLEQVKE